MLTRSKQRQRNKQPDNGYYLVTASKLQQSDGVFCAVRVEMLYVGQLVRVQSVI
jgi:hypothetical protein